MGVQTDTELARKYFKACASVMDLGHWALEITSGELSDSDAEVSKVGAHAAEITLGDGWWKADEHRRRNITCHELIHLYTWPLAELVPDSHAQARTDVEERLVDDIAAIVSPMLPLWGGRKWRRK